MSHWHALWRKKKRMWPTAGAPQEKAMSFRSCRPLWTKSWLTHVQPGTLSATILTSSLASSSVQVTSPVHLSWWVLEITLKSFEARTWPHLQENVPPFCWTSSFRDISQEAHWERDQSLLRDAKHFRVFSGTCSTLWFTSWLLIAGSIVYSFPRHFGTSWRHCILIVALNVDKPAQPPGPVSWQSKLTAASVCRRRNGLPYSSHRVAKWSDCVLSDHPRSMFSVSVPFVQEKTR
jgi:hypothetical protein